MCYFFLSSNPPIDFVVYIILLCKYKSHSWSIYICILLDFRGFGTHIHDANLPDLVNESAGHIPRLCYMRSKMDDQVQTHTTRIDTHTLTHNSNMCPPWIITTGGSPLHWAVPFTLSFSFPLFTFPQWTFPLQLHPHKMLKFALGGNEWLKSTMVYQAITTWKQLTVSLFFRTTFPYTDFPLFFFRRCLWSTTLRVNFVCSFHYLLYGYIHWDSLLWCDPYHCC